MSAANAAISSVSMARLARAAGIRAEARNGVSCRLCRISARSLALARENISLISAASFGCIDRFDAIRNCTSVERFGRRRCRRGGGNLGCERHALIRTCRLQPEPFQDFGRRARIDRKPRPNGRARRVVDLIDQAGGQLDKLPLFVGAMGVGLNVEVGQHAQQGGSDIDALAAGERHQPVEAREEWRCGHVRVRD